MCHINFVILFLQSCIQAVFAGCVQQLQNLFSSKKLTYHLGNSLTLLLVSVTIIAVSVSVTSTILSNLTSQSNASLVRVNLSKQVANQHISLIKQYIQQNPSLFMDTTNSGNTSNVQTIFNVKSGNLTVYSQNSYNTNYPTNLPGFYTLDSNKVGATGSTAFPVSATTTANTCPTTIGGLTTSNSLLYYCQKVNAKGNQLLFVSALDTSSASCGTDSGSGTAGSQKCGLW